MNFRVNKDLIGKLCFYIVLMVFGSDAAKAVLGGVNMLN